MRRHETNQLETVSKRAMLRTALPRLVLCALGCFWRGTLEKSSLPKSIIIMFLSLQPFGNRISGWQYPNAGTLHSGQELLAVNGRPLTGAAIYFQELRGV